MLGGCQTGKSGGKSRPLGLPAVLSRSRFHDWHGSDDGRLADDARLMPVRYVFLVANVNNASGLSNLNAVDGALDRLPVFTITYYCPRG